MLRKFWKHLVGPRPRAARRRPFAPAVEALGARLAPAITASFNPTTGFLVVLGDAKNNTLQVSRNAAGRLFVNGGAVPVQGGTPTVANTTLVRLFGLGGNDSLKLNEAGGALPSAHLFGGDGNDALLGGAGNDKLLGQAGNDALRSLGGADTLLGGDGADTLTGGTGNDRVAGEADNDRLVWKAGDGSDLNDGGAGVDTVEANGGNGGENFAVAPKGIRVRFTQTGPAAAALDLGTVEILDVRANGGDDVLAAGTGLAGVIQLTVDGGAGNDTLFGGDGADVLLGGDGNDVFTGGRGDDLVLMGAGDDVFVWSPGDESDTVEGQAGADALRFNGSNANETVILTPSGNRLRLFRDVAGVTLDVDDTERIDVNALGGADTITVGNLSGTDVKAVNLDLAAAAGGGAGDGAADAVAVTGTNGNDTVLVSGGVGAVQATGLAAQVVVRGAEAGDRLAVNALAGQDAVNAANLAADALVFAADGGAGDDVLIGGAGADTLAGGDGDDVLLGGPGLDTLDGGDGSNVVVQG